MTILVTGAAGFIGFHVSKALLGQGRAVLGVDNLNDYYDPTLKEARLAQLRRQPGFRFERLEIADTAAVAALFCMIMATDPVMVNASDALDDVAFIMSDKKIGSVIVNEADGSFLGIFTVTDALNALIEICRAARGGHCSS